MERKVYRTGGADRHWLFDSNDVESIPTISNALVHYDTYFEEERDYETTLAIVLDKLLDNLPEELRSPVSLVYLSGVSYRSAGRTLGLDHKTVKLRADKGIKALRDRLKDTAWIATLLDGSLPDEYEEEKISSDESVLQILNKIQPKKEPK
jgi:DNA-directed RNA polymerase specialized sigma24 family protein